MDVRFIQKYELYRIVFTSIEQVRVHAYQTNHPAIIKGDQGTAAEYGTEYNDDCPVAPIETLGLIEKSVPQAIDNIIKVTTQKEAIEELGKAYYYFSVIIFFLKRKASWLIMKKYSSNNICHLSLIQQAFDNCNGSPYNAMPDGTAKY